jgi:hypothetical protein
MIFNGFLHKLLCRTDRASSVGLVWRDRDIHQPHWSERCNPSRVCYNDIMIVSASPMIKISAGFLVVAALTVFAPLALASGADGSRGSFASSGPRKDSTDKPSDRRIPGFQRRYPTRIIVVPAPSYYYSPYYFAPASAFVNASFFCLEHGVGFVSRVGFIDHLGGTHKFALEHAAAICPANVDTCVFDGVWPLY